MCDVCPIRHGTERPGGEKASPREEKMKTSTAAKVGAEATYKLDYEDETDQWSGFIDSGRLVSPKWCIETANKL